MRVARVALLLWAVAVHAAAAEPPGPASIVTRLPGRERVVALTFDACQAAQPTRLDHGITDYLVAHGVPFTVFMGGRFARDHADEVRALASHPGVSIQNHSWSHPRDMRTLSDQQVRDEVAETADELQRVTGRRPTLFRFPGGNADARTVALVEAMGYRVVHWRWAEGDPARSVDADMLVEQTLQRTRAGDILIFHVNGRGWHTAEALPRIIDGLTARGFRFVTVEGRLAAGQPPAVSTKPM